MGFDPARPRYCLPFAGQEYELLGTFGLIEAVEYAMKEHVGRVAVSLVNGMPSFDLARLLSTILAHCGQKMTAKEAGDLLWGEVGLTGEDNDLLRLHLYHFLTICLAPPGEREGKAKAAGEAMGKLGSPAASPGETTAASA